MPDSACAGPAAWAVLAGALCASGEAADAVATGADGAVVAGPAMDAAAGRVAGLSQAASASAAAIAASASGGRDVRKGMRSIASPRPAIMAQSVDGRRRLAHWVAWRRRELRQRDAGQRDR